MRPPNGILPRLRITARRFLDPPREDSKPLTKAAALAFQVVVSCVRKLQRDRASQMASALAFDTLFSLLPLLVLALIVLHSVRGLEDAGAELRTLILDFLVPESLVELDADLVGPRDPGGPTTVEEFRDARQVLRLRMDEVLETLSQVSFAGIGVAGFLLFLYGATTLMRTVESSFNLLYQADAPRPWSRLPLYFMLLTLGPVALVAAQFLQDQMLRNLGSWMGGWLAAPFAYGAPLVVTCMVLALAFRTIPNTWVSWRAAVIGALWSGIAWFAFQEIFGFYVGRASTSSLYGALALLPLFLLWIYGSWLIILAGLALSFIAQYLDADENWARQRLLPGDPRWLLPIMARIAEAFTSGEKTTTVRLSHELRLPPRVLRPYIRLLERRGYVRRLRDRGGEHVLTLAKPRSAIKVKELLELVSPARSAVAGELLLELRRCELELAGDLTLEDVVRRPAGARKEAPSAPQVAEPAVES